MASKKHFLTTGRCPVTHKRRFDDELSARLALTNVKVKEPGHRTYRCPHCSGWHLTAMPKKTGTG